MGLIFKNKTIGLFKNNYYLLTSLFFFLSWPTYDFWFLQAFPLFAWFAFIPLFMYVKGKDYKEIIIKTFIAGIIGNYLSYSWIGHFGINMPGGPAIVLGFLMPYMTVFLILKIIGAEFLSRKFENLRFVIYPSVWIFVDWINSLGFITFPWAYMGYSQYPIVPIIQIVSLTGILGLNFIIILFNITLTELIRLIYTEKISFLKIFKLSQGIKFISVLLIVASIFIFGAVRLKLAGSEYSGTMKVSMIQSCISPWKSWYQNRNRYLYELKSLTNEALADNPDLIIWSESATLETFTYGHLKNFRSPFQKDILDYMQSTGKPFITGEIGIVESFDAGRYRRMPQNNAVLINTSGIPVQAYSKMILVPFGEWFPYEKWLPSIKRLLETFGASDFVPGNKHEIFEVNGAKFGVLVCYEGLFHKLCNQYGKAGADYFINITNDGWTDTFAGHMQHSSVSVFRAVENGIWYVRAGNTGLTAIIDPFGRIVKSIPLLTKGYLSGSLDFKMNRKTFFSENGDIFFFITAAFLVVLSLILIYKKIRKRSD
jgi:apolipoprotein N-acyltransferase